jgi:hypothetical protein
VIGLIRFRTTFGLPFAVFLLRNFFIGIPKVWGAKTRYVPREIRDLQAGR